MFAEGRIRAPIIAKGDILGCCGQHHDKCQPVLLFCTHGQRLCDGFIAEKLGLEIDEFLGLADRVQMGIFKFGHHRNRRHVRQGHFAFRRHRPQKRSGVTRGPAGKNVFHIQQMLACFCRDLSGDDDLHVVPRIIRRAVVAGGIIAAVVHIQTTDIKRFGVKNRQFLVVGHRHQRRWRKFAGLQGIAAAYGKRGQIGGALQIGTHVRLDLAQLRTNLFERSRPQQCARQKTDTCGMHRNPRFQVLRMA